MADNQKQLYCPNCMNKMEKIYFEEQKVHLDVCLDCGGIFFDNNELKKFDKIDSDIEPLEVAFKDKEFKITKYETKKTCPLCGAEMVKNNISKDLELKIDECYSCGGKFLSYYKLKVIKNSIFQKLEKEGYIEAISKEYLQNPKILEEYANVVDKKYKSNTTLEGLVIRALIPTHIICTIGYTKIYDIVKKLLAEEPGFKLY